MERNGVILGEILIGNDGDKIILAEWEGGLYGREFITWVVPEGDLSRKRLGHYFNNKKDATIDFLKRIKNNI